MRPVDAWFTAALALIAATVGAFLLAHGALPSLVLLWWVPLVPALGALAALGITWMQVREQREAANQQRLAIERAALRTACDRFVRNAFVGGVLIDDH